MAIRALAVELSPFEGPLEGGPSVFLNEGHASGKAPGLNIPVTNIRTGNHKTISFTTESDCNSHFLGTGADNHPPAVFGRGR
ncbi:MAG: hypothetical protein ACRD4S_00670 [Candidatus Acidiferrales bacterium]